VNAHALRLLEFDQVREQVAELTLGAAGERAVRGASVSADPLRIGAIQELVADWRTVLAGEGHAPDAAFPDIEPLFGILGKEGTVLDAEQLAAVSLFVAAARSLARSASGVDEGRPLRDRAAALADLTEVRREIARYVSDTGEIKDEAVPELKRLSARIRSTESKIDRQAAAYLRDPQHAQYWTSDTPTQRNGRTVLPLSANYRNRVKGIVHEVSQTGATLFVEPADLVDLNNELREVQAAYDQEIQRILRDLTATVRGRLAELEALEAETAELDAMLARARYGEQHGCFPAGTAAPPNAGAGPREAGPGKADAASAAPALRLTGARHPLLRGPVVPINVELHAPHRGLIVTGPNTGGKTVALKTVGLLALMNQFGLEIPADEGSRLPIFDDVFADIGDEQSLEQSLSTFSGHMTTIAEILSRADGRSLVLLDELGAGTDPEEGSALAMSILDEIERVGATAVVTTHHGALKNYAYRSAVFENASVEFDPEQLAPTYHLLIGVPGTSHALEIAARNGIPDTVVDRARGYVREGQGDEARIIRDLTEKQVELHRATRERDAELADLRRRQAELEEQSQRLSERELSLRKEGLQEFERLSRETRRRLENLVREIREGELTREKTARVREFLDELSDTAREKEQDIASAEREQSRRTRPEGTPVELEPGMEVAVGESGRRGVIRRRGRGDAWVVETESVRLELPADQLVPVGSAGAGGGGRGGPGDGGHPGGGHPGGGRVSYERGRSPAPALELDLRGYRLEEAIAAVDRQIDDCLLAGLDRFSIIHGKGEGVLSTGIREHLAGREEIASHAFARPEEGGFGKTIVHLRDR
jgi:DNA mismatch repair protein MutS2